MRTLTFAATLLVLVGLAATAASAAPTKPTAKQAPKAKAKIPPPKAIDSLGTKPVSAPTSANTDTASAKTHLDARDSALRLLDSTRAQERACRTELRNSDSALHQTRDAGVLLARRLDSLRAVASSQSGSLLSQKDSLRILDSLRQASRLDTGIVLFLPVAYDTVHHGYDSTLARELTKRLRLSLLQCGAFQLWEPAARERGTRSPEDWKRIANRKGAGQVLTGSLSYSKDTLIYTAQMTSLTTGAVVRQAQVIGFHREADPVPRFSRIATSQLFGIAQEPDPYEARPEAPIWRRLLLLGVFGIFAGTVVALSW